MLTNLTSAEVAAWVQALVSSVAIVVGALVVIWQTYRARLERSEREARVLDGLALLLIHLKECAQAARSERKKLARLSHNHPAEPSTRFQELLDAMYRFPLEAAHGAVPMNAILVGRRTAKELLPYIGPEPELDTNPDYERVFPEYVRTLDSQVLVLQEEARRLRKGGRALYAMDCQ